MGKNPMVVDSSAVFMKAVFSESYHFTSVNSAYLHTATGEIKYTIYQYFKNIKNH